jgi:hypothetical protein
VALLQRGERKNRAKPPHSSAWAKLLRCNLNRFNGLSIRFFPAEVAASAEFLANRAVAARGNYARRADDSGRKT